MKYTGRWFVAILAAVVLSACSSVMVGRDFELSSFAAKAELGVTTQAQVRAWLGEPTSMGFSMGSDGEKLEEWAYYYGIGELSGGGPVRVKVLQVKFDKQDKVHSYNWSSSR